MIVIVGAGLAGLICAKELQRRGRRDFLLLEAESEPGGRVRSRVTTDGFMLDRGFQVLLDSYPAVQRHLNLAALEPRYFDNGAILHDAGRSWTLANPLLHPGDLWQSTLSDVFSLADRARLAMLVAELVLTPDDTLLAAGRSADDVSTAHYLVKRGFGSAIIERFFRPFFGGVLLEDRLATSASLFRYYLKKFATGRALLPARGMGEISRQLAAGLMRDAVRFNCRIGRIETDSANSHARAVHTTAGERIPCKHLLLATDAPASVALLGHENESTKAQSSALGCTTLYFSTATSLYHRPLLVLPAGSRGMVRDFSQITNIAPEYAPNGSCLISATVLDNKRSLDEPAMADVAQTEIAAIFPAAKGQMRFLTSVHVPYAQHPHPAGYARFLLPSPAPTRLENVWLTGDQTTACSIQTAMESGERAAAYFTTKVR